MKFWYLIIWLIIVKFNKSKGSENNTEDDYFRLPNSVIPERYILKIRTVLEDNKFKHISSVKIEIRCKKPTNKITLHSRNLKINEIKLIRRKHGQVEVENYDFEQDYDFLHIYLNEPLVEDDWYRLEIDFSGKIMPGMTGFYRSCYKDKPGQKNWIAITQFEPTNARAAFPCFDEPALKARFSIQLGHRFHLNAISNMPVKPVTTEPPGNNLIGSIKNDSRRIWKNKDDERENEEDERENEEGKWKDKLKKWGKGWGEIWKKWKNWATNWKNWREIWKNWNTFRETWRDVKDLEENWSEIWKKWEEMWKNKKDKGKNWEGEYTKGWDYKFDDIKVKVEGPDKNHPAMSNMPLKSTENSNGIWHWTMFKETLKMSTYLVAYSVNDFAFNSTQKTNGYGNTTINIWAQKNSLQQVKFATEIAPKILSFFEKYFDMAYPLPKTDFLAVPDFPARAMENWGLIMFRESKLLYVPGVSTEHDKHAIVTTMAHEIANYWFGDLVTIKWWSYFWLKQGIAIHLARNAERYLFPTMYNYGTADLISDMQAVYEVDALQTSRPVSVPIRDPSRMHEIYDSITNAKGSCVIRMMELFLGNYVLRKGLVQYLYKYKYNSTEPDNLWHSLTLVALEHGSLSEKLSVKIIMDTWTLQAGYPLVTVDRDYTSDTVTVSQKRFLENVRKHDDSCYCVPLTYTTKEASNFNQTKPRRWLPCPTKNITFELGYSRSWVLFNIQASGLYRVNYDERNWNMLIEQLETNHKKIKTLNRVLLIDDVMELAMVGYVDFKIAFDLVKYIRKDNRFATWSRVLGKLIKVANLLDHTSEYELIQTFISNLVMPAFRNLGGIRSLKAISKFHLEIIKVACNIGNHICEQEVADMFSEWKQSNGNYKIPTEIREIVYCQGVKSGSEDDWDYLWEYYKNSNVATEKVSILGALGCTEKHELLARYLAWIIEEDSGIRPQDIKNVFTSVVQNKAGYYNARIFFYENVKKIYEIEAPKGESMRDLLALVTNSLRTETEFNEYEEFLKENEQYFNRAHLATKQTLEKLVVRKNWYDNIYPKLVDALKQQIEILERKSSSNPSNAEAS